MKVQMHSVHFDADQKLLDFVQQRLNKLETFYDKVTEGEVIMRLNNKDGIENKTVEIKLLVPGNILLAKRMPLPLKPPPMPPPIVCVAKSPSTKRKRWRINSCSTRFSLCLI